MQLLEDAVIAALAAVGLVTLLFLLISALVHPCRAGAALDAAVIVPCRAGEGARLERTVRALTRSRYEYGGFCRILLLDRGMDEETKNVASLLCRDDFDVALCTLDTLLKEWE